LITPLRERFAIDVEHGEDLSAKGNIVDHEYEIERDGEKVAEVSKKWFRVRDTYGVQLAQGQDVPLILAISVCVDQMARG
ncbi:MAG TPA: LURP-one-related family protein, partial [Ornithinibacter sp.]|nr:LURP-one-related family protein [Ornithinibacter sp.]